MGLVSDLAMLLRSKLNHHKVLHMLRIILGLQKKDLQRYPPKRIRIYVCILLNGLPSTGPAGSLAAQKESITVGEYKDILAAKDTK